MSLFLVLSLLSGVLELGGLFLSSANGAQGWALFVLPLMYQFGNLLSIAPQVTPRQAGAAGIGLLLAGLLFPSPAILIVQVMAASVCIQAARAAQKDNCPTWLKRTFRIGGFVFSPVMAIYPSAVLACCLLLPAAVLLRPGVPKAPSHDGKLVSVMVFHQMHYFVYTYIMPAWFFTLTGSLIGSGAMFALTWVVYLMPQVIAEHFIGVDSRKLFFACHGFLALTMGVLCIAAACGNVPLMCAAWMLSGLGGGSVFCIKSLTPACQSTDLTFSENVGHVAGVLGAILTLTIFPGADVPMLTGASCIFVCLTLVLAAIHMRKERRRYARAG